MDGSLLNQNEKIKKTGMKHGIRLFSFDLLPGITCPNARLCMVGCFGTQGWYHKPVVKNRLLRNFEISKTKEFPDLLSQELKLRKVECLRIHSVGDFYNMGYLVKWVKIIVRNPGVRFYSYTKQVIMMKGMDSLPNLEIVFSLSGTEDDFIDLKNDRHCKVFETSRKLKRAGYVNATSDDLKVLGNQKIGIVYHGQRKWERTGFADE